MGELSRTRIGRQTKAIMIMMLIMLLRKNRTIGICENKVSIKERKMEEGEKRGSIVKGLTKE